MTQKDLSEMVARRSGRTFSQQSLQKLEANPKGSSRFMHHILAILEDAESGDRGVIKREVDLLEERHLAALRVYVETLNRQQGT